ncbi:hypothetical protein MPNT_10040 [Candidatus Methylacidithermus pantelleriae]|uniref:Uncharacterized protein n=1 Tax=Candidatus Methylacidithermus pantelleriae TaxID=2744239 RepID=A0A8J2BPU1_9BACT|nr:hypothetical protein MPNT_10040 [Candidatus Methylacidithermus pantelleriae]
MEKILAGISGQSKFGKDHKGALFFRRFLPQGKNFAGIILRIGNSDGGNGHPRSDKAMLVEIKKGGSLAHTAPTSVCRVKAPGAKLAYSILGSLHQKRFAKEKPRPVPRPPDFLPAPSCSGSSVEPTPENPKPRTTLPAAWPELSCRAFLQRGLNYALLIESRCRRP